MPRGQATDQTKEEKQTVRYIERAGKSQSPIQTAFLNIREQNDESFVKSERILRNFMTAELKISKEGGNDISSESVRRIG